MALLQWYRPGATPVGDEQSLGAQGLCLGLLVALEGCVTLATMNSGFPKTQELRLLAGPTSLQPAAIAGEILLMSLRH